MGALISVVPENIMHFELGWRLLLTGGMKEEDARTIAKDLVAADMRDLYSHGISRVPMYLKRIDSKCVKPVPATKVEKAETAVLRVDGDDGMGFLVAHKAVEEGLKLANQLPKDWRWIATAIQRPMQRKLLKGYVCRLAMRKGQVWPC